MAQLTDLNRVKDTIPNYGVNADEAFLVNLLNSASTLIEKKCTRSFALANYDQLVDGSGTTTLLLQHFPIVSVSRVRGGVISALVISYTDTTASMANVSISATGLTLNATKNAIAITPIVLNFADYPTMLTMANQINTLPNWKCQVPGDARLQGWQTNDFAILAQSNSAQTSITYNALIGSAFLPLHRDELTGSPYLVLSSEGQLYYQGGFGYGSRNYRITYSAGFVVIPEPIQVLCCELVAAAYRFRDINPNVASENLQYWSYTNLVSKGWDSLSLQSKLAIGLYKDWRCAPWRQY